MNNNLFQYATSELSQDAFICWLLSYALKDCDKDKALTECAKEFLRFFIPELKDEPVYLSEPPQRQYKSIDVLITVNDKYKVIIEDKTHTSDHDNQLMRYREIIEADFPEYKCVGVYYKIGFQSDLKNVKEAEYIICNKERILSILGKYISLTTSDIFKNYYEYLNEFNKKANMYHSLPLDCWGWEQINGFYNCCQKTFTDIGLNIGFGYVPNKSGGFYGMWMGNAIHIDAEELECDVYVQCEFANGKLNICYKAGSINGTKIRKKNREALIGKTVDGKRVPVASKYNFTKPPRYGTGKTVTLAIYDEKVYNYKDAINAIKNAVDDFYKITEELITKD